VRYRSPSVQNRKESQRIKKQHRAESVHNRHVITSTLHNYRTQAHYQRIIYQHRCVTAQYLRNTAQYWRKWSLWRFPADVLRHTV